MVSCISFVFFCGAFKGSLWQLLLVFVTTEGTWICAETDQKMLYIRAWQDGCARSQTRNFSHPAILQDYFLVEGCSYLGGLIFSVFCKRFFVPHTFLVARQLSTVRRLHSDLVLLPLHDMCLSNTTGLIKPELFAHRRHLPLCMFDCNLMWQI